MKKLINLAVEISNLVQECCKADPMVAQAYEDQMDDESDDWDFQYAEAVDAWRASGKPPAFFSTTSPLLLACKKKLEARFGLEILNTKDGLRKAQEMSAETTVVDGHQQGHTVSSKELQEQTKRDIIFLNGAQKANKKWALN